MSENTLEKISLQNKNLAKEYKGTMSVSKCLGYLQKGFDQEGTAKKCFEKGYDDPESKYYHMTVEAILESWQAKSATSCRYGSLLDDYIGMCLNGETQKLEVWKMDNSYDYDMRLKSLCNGFDQFYKVLSTNTDYKYVCREQKMFIKSKDGNVLNGRFDCLFYSYSLDKYLLIDWKQSEKIDKENKWEKLLGPLYDKDACNGNTYSIQLLMYKKALCETYGITTPDKIDTLICQMIPNMDNDSSVNALTPNYMVHNVIIDYNSILLDQIIDFAYKKMGMTSI